MFNDRSGMLKMNVVKAFSGCASKMRFAHVIRIGEMFILFLITLVLVFCRHQYMVKQEMLAYASILQGQSLVDNMGGKHSLRRDAMEAFLGGASFARNAGNYDLVMTAARHYWNACIDLVSQPMERQLLKEPIKTILDCITATWNKKSKIEVREREKIWGFDFLLLLDH